MSRSLLCFILVAVAPIGSIALNFGEGRRRRHGKGGKGRQPPAQPRVLLYVTTYNSNEHLTYMKCQPKLLARMTALNKVDVLLHVGETDPPKKHDLSHEQWQRLLDAWPTHQRKSVHFGENPGKQAGAKKAMHDALSEGWFKGYDWVIRINPDVIIYDESPLFRLLQEQRNWAVVMKCYNGGHYTNTDFMAFRPEHLQEGAFSDWAGGDKVSAEEQAERAFHQIYATGNYTYLKKGGHQNICHLQSGGIYHGREPTCEAALKNMGWQDSFANGIPGDSRRRLEDDEPAWREVWRRESENDGGDDGGDDSEESPRKQ